GDALFSAEAERRIAREARDAIEAGEPRLVDLRQDACGAACTIYVEPQTARAQLLVLGSGAVAESLARIGAASGLQVRVVGRGASLERYPAAARADDDPTFETLSPPPAGAHVVVTTGHEADEEALKVALRGKPASVQLVASSRRAPRVVEALKRAGLPPESLALVRAPAGLDLGSEGPDEIALSIVAEIVRQRRGGTGRPLAEIKGTAAPREEKPAPAKEGARPSPGTSVEEDDFRPPGGAGEEFADFRDAGATGPRGTERYTDEEEEGEEPGR
ncbi:XdhC family protein, partial [bacterium]|nr:XdhC family protein [bacterium]